MSQTGAILYIYAIQQIRSQLQELIEGDVERVDQELVEILKKLEEGQEGQDIEDKFRQVLKLHKKARAKWVALNKGGVVRGISGSGATDAGLYGESSPKEYSITCGTCKFFNSLSFWDSSNPPFCLNSDYPKHRLKLV